MSKRSEENKYCVYKLIGSETLGSCLRVQPCSEEVPAISKCSFQWFRLSSEGSWREAISGMIYWVKFLSWKRETKFLMLVLSSFSGANRSVYASDPLDVGRVLQVDVVSNGKKLTLTIGHIQPGWFWFLLTVLFIFWVWSCFPHYYWGLEWSRSERLTIWSLTDAGVGSHVETLLQKSNSEFKVCYP